MSTLASDVQKSAVQLAAAQKEQQTEAAFHTFFRSEYGRNWASNDANRIMIANYIGDQPITPETIAAAVSFIGDHLSPGDERSQARLDQEDAQVEQEKAEAVRAQQKAMWGMSKEDLRAEIRRQAEITNAPKPVTLINSSTGVEYTKRELLALPAADIRKLLSYPNGQDKRPEFRQAFDRILNTPEGA